MEPKLPFAILVEAFCNTHDIKQLELARRMKIAPGYLSMLKSGSPKKKAHLYDNLKRWAKIFSIPIQSLRNILDGDTEALSECNFIQSGPQECIAITHGRRGNDPISPGAGFFTKKVIRMLPLVMWEQVVDWEKCTILTNETKYIYVDADTDGVFGVSLEKVRCRDIPSSWLHGAVIVKPGVLPRIGDYALIIEPGNNPAIRQLCIQNGSLVLGKYNDFDVTEKRSYYIGLIVALVIGGMIKKPS